MLKTVKKAILTCYKDVEKEDENDIIPDNHSLCIYFELNSIVCIHGDRDTWQKIQDVIQKWWPGMAEVNVEIYLPQSYCFIIGTVPIYKVQCM